MFGRKKNPEPDGPYRVEKVVGGNKLLQKLLNERHAEGYDLVWILQQQVGGSSSGRDVIFRLRD